MAELVFVAVFTTICVEKVNKTSEI